jgi:hypothetical protein
MSVTLGLAVGADRVRAVLARGEAVAWASEAGVGADTPLSAAVAELLAQAPLGRIGRPAVVATLGPALSQTRRITGLPAVDDVRLLTQIVHEGAGRFFLRNGRPLAVSGIRVDEPGVAWAAAFDAGTLLEVEAGCRAAGLRLRAVAPAVALLGVGLQDERVVWVDGDAEAEVRMDAAGRVLAVRRLPPGGAAPAGDPTPVDALARLGEHGWRFADAYGAARMPADEALVLRPGRGGADGQVPAWRLALAGTAAALALAAALVLPLRTAAQEKAAQQARLDAVHRREGAALASDSALAQVTAALREVAAFDSTRASATLLLADINRALPRGSALLSVQVDTAGGTLVALTPRAASVLGPLDRVPGISTPAIVGPVTHEGVGGREMERVTLHFGIDPAVRAKLGRTDALEAAQ